jgi:hypothetical protein
MENVFRNFSWDKTRGKNIGDPGPVEEDGGEGSRVAWWVR